MNDDVHALSDTPTAILRYWEAIELLTPQNLKLRPETSYKLPGFDLRFWKHYGTHEPWQPFFVDIHVTASDEKVPDDTDVKRRKLARKLFDRQAHLTMTTDSHARLIGAHLGDEPADENHDSISHAAARELGRLLGRDARIGTVIDDDAMDHLISALRLKEAGKHYAIIYCIRRPDYPQGVCKRHVIKNDKPDYVLHTDDLNPKTGLYRNQFKKRCELLKENGGGGNNPHIATWLPHRSYQINVAINQKTAFRMMIHALAPKGEDSQPSGNSDKSAESVALDEREPTGYAAGLTISVRDDGVLLDGSLHISQYCRSLSELAIAVRHGLPIPKSWPLPDDGMDDGMDDAISKMLNQWRESYEKRHAENPPDPLTFTAITDCIAFLCNELGFDGESSPIERSIVSVQLGNGISKRDLEPDFMDSFYRQDLSHLIDDADNDPKKLSHPLARYLCARHPSRTDLNPKSSGMPGSARPDAASFILEHVEPRSIPPACWPSNPQYTLALHQQLAVNEILKAFPSGGDQPLLGVNGPPGTGKTTLLRDVIAAVIAERAKKLAKLDRAENLFADKAVSVGGGYKYWKLNEEITGFEIVVASANNRAVENISLELPTEDAIHEYWRKAITADFRPRVSSSYGGFAFSETASAIAKSIAGKRDDFDDSATQSWALFCARLGNKTNWSEFFKAFTKEFVRGELRADDEPDRNGEPDRNVDSTDWNKLWDDAKRSFADAQNRERSIRDARQADYERDHEHHARKGKTDDLGPSHSTYLITPYLDREWNEARTRVFLEALALHQTAILANRQRFQDNLGCASDIIRHANVLPADMVMNFWRTLFLVVPVISTTFASVSRMFGVLGSGIGATDAHRFGLALIDEAGQAQPQYAAGLLQRVRHCVAVGDPVQLEPVDTMPPQVRRLLAYLHMGSDASMGPESDNVQECVDRQTPLGQYTKLGGGTGDDGATGNDGNEEHDQWIGMPLIVHRRCLDPMFTICNTMAYERRMVPGLNVRPEAPITAFAADAAVRDGSATGEQDEPKNPAEALWESCWYDSAVGAQPDAPHDATTATHETADEQWRPQEGAILRGLLAKLHESGVDYEDILALSPFNAVAEHVRGIFGQMIAQDGTIDKDTADKLAKDRSGTVHISQGREADVVILVLGSRTGARGNGSRQWVNEKPNMLNVAVSRAKIRLYVIGNHADWKDGRYSRYLADELTVTHWHDDRPADRPDTQ